MSIVIQTSCRRRILQAKIILEDTAITRRWMQIVAVCCLGIFPLACIGQLHVLVDHVGYETHSTKQALILGTEQSHPKQFSLVDTVTGKVVLAGNLTQAGQVNAWRNRVFWTADFSSWQKAGHYVVRTQSDEAESSSCAFDIEDNLLERET